MRVWILTFLFIFSEIKRSSSLFSHYVNYNTANPFSASKDGCTTLGNEGSIDFKSNTSVVSKCWKLRLFQPKYITLSLIYVNIDKSCETSYLILQSDQYYTANGVYPSVKRFWCGDVQPQTLTVKRDWINLTLVSKNTRGTMPAFKLNYSVDDQCMINRQIHSYTIITSVGFPNSNIVPDCAWNISLLEDSSSLPLQFVLNECDFYQSGYISVYDGPDESSPLIWNHVCDDTVRTGEVLATSTGPNMLIRYRNNMRYGRGFNATVKVKGYCLPGSYSCGDQDTCYTSRQHCNGQRDCASGFDELDCTDTCSNDLFWCGGDTWNCYTAKQYCDGNKDCSSGVDESQCKECAPGAFHCQENNKCIYERWRCDGQPDCSEASNASDEVGCAYTASRQVITAAIIGSLICGLLLAVALGCSCKLYTLRSATRNRRTRQVVPTPLGRVARQLLQREAPPSYSMTVDGVDSDSPDSSFRRSSGSSRRRRNNRERRSRRRHRHRDPQLRRARPDPSATAAAPHGSVEIVQPNISEDQIVRPPPDIPLPPIPSPTPEEQVQQLPHPSNQHPDAPSSSMNEVQDATTEASSSHEDQAPPIPKKKRIRPVMVEAPCSDEMVEDIPNCVYPNPPAYHEIVEPQNSGSPIPHLHDNRDDIVVDHEAPSGTMINRFLAKFGSNRNPHFWRNIFRSGNVSPPFHQLENQPDSVSGDSDSLVLSLESNQMDVPSSSSQELDATQALLLFKRTVKPTSFYPPPAHIKELEAGGSDEEVDEEIANLRQPPRAFSPVEMREMPSHNFTDPFSFPPSTSSDTIENNS